MTLQYERLGQKHALPIRLQTDTLTVWRTLWMELDYMELTPDMASFWFPSTEEYSGTGPLPDGGWAAGDIGTYKYADSGLGHHIYEIDNFDVKFEPHKPDIIALTEAMKRACILVAEIDQSSLHSTVTFTRAFTPDQAGFERFEDAETEARDLDVNDNGEHYWCIYGIGMYELLDDMSGDFCHNQGSLERLYGHANVNSFNVFSETIRDGYADKKAREELLHETAPLSPGTMLSKITFHEVTHIFGL